MTQGASFKLQSTNTPDLSSVTVWVHLTSGASSGDSLVECDVFVDDRGAAVVGLDAFLHLGHAGCIHAREATHQLIQALAPRPVCPMLSIRGTTD